jgi:5-methyltetrahydropteroyltriglutamate--homocysteine methyltransferase
MPGSKPPFRADHVGSLLRSAPLKRARELRDRGQITSDQLRAVEDLEIERIIRKQEDIGLRLATDGEYRRAVWSVDFFEHLQGVQGYIAEQGVQFKGVVSTPRTFRIVDKIGFAAHPMLEHFKFLKAHVRGTPKMTIPSPSVMHFRYGSSALKPVYPDLDVFFSDLAAAYKAAVRAFYDAGCRYLQLDDTVWAYLCSQDQLAQSRARGDDPERLRERYARTINQALEGRPADLTVTMHACRGNFRSAWISEGGYEPVAETLFNAVNVDGYFLEYDTERAGGFEPLRFLPRGNKVVVLGLITSKIGALEKKNDVKRRIDEATRFAPLGQLALSPQCGFASTEEGNILSEDEQWAKLRLIVEIAQEVWDEV